MLVYAWVNALTYYPKIILHVVGPCQRLVLSVCSCVVKYIQCNRQKLGLLSSEAGVTEGHLTVANNVYIYTLHISQ